VNKRKTGWWVLPVVALATVALDQFTKYLVVTNLALYESWAPIPALSSVLEIHYVTNNGAAFGLFQNGSLFFMIVAVIVSAVILIYSRHLPHGQWLLRVALGLMLGGALGNFIDRLRLGGQVIDFVDTHFWPIWNVADASIVVGVGLMALVLLREDRAERRAADRREGAEEHASSG
jgi:signal peptidase II